MSNNIFDPIKYNCFNIKPGDKVLVKINPYKYFASVNSISVDTKNKKVFAKLSNVDKGLPIKVDIRDCEKISLLDPAKFS